MSDSLWPHGLHHTRLPCPSRSPRVCSNSCPLSWWRHPTISSSVAPFFSCPQSFPASGSFPVIQHLTSGIGASASISVLPVNIQGWFPLRIDLFNLLADKRTHKSPPAPQFKSINSSVLSLLSLLSWKWHPLEQSAYFKDRGGDEVLPISQVRFTGQSEVMPSLTSPQCTWTGPPGTNSRPATSSSTSLLLVVENL